jgi:glycosyltransferase involved in cell wall biosynthesis
MKLAFNAVALLSPLTGVGRYAQEIASQLSTMPEVEPQFFYGTHWRDSLEIQVPARVQQAMPLIRAHLPWSYEIRRWVQMTAFKRGIKNKNFQLYHEPNHLLLPFDGPSVLSVHDLSWIRYPQMHPIERVRAMNKYFEPGLRRATRILTDSKFIKHEIIEVFGVRPEIIHPVGLGVEAIFSPRNALQTRSTLTELGLQHGQYLLAVGTLEPRKNLGVALRAFMALPAATRKRHPLVLVGMTGWHTSDLEQTLAPLIRAGEVRQLGYLPRKDLVNVIAGATALVYPSVYEGFGLPPLEAMACGVPVIASNVSSIPEVVGSTGILVNPQDETQLMQAMLTVTQAPEIRDALAAQALARSRTFSWTRCARETVDVYRAAVA